MISWSHLVWFVLYFLTCWYVNDILWLIILLGEWLSGSAGMGFTPHIITIAIGEVCYFLSLIWFSCCFSQAWCISAVFNYLFIYKSNLYIYNEFYQLATQVIVLSLETKLKYRSDYDAQAIHKSYFRKSFQNRFQPCMVIIYLSPCCFIKTKSNSP